MFTPKPFLLLAALCLAGTAHADPGFPLKQLEAMALASNRAILASRDQVEAARAGVASAQAFPNPELEYLQGNSRARISGPTTGTVKSVTLTQPLDLPHRRGPRIDGAQAALDSAQAGSTAFSAEVITRLRLRYFEVLRRQAELKAAREDQGLMEKIRGGIALRVETGEAPRFELVKADAEMLNAQKASQSAELRTRQARAALRSLVGPDLPENFQLDGHLDQVPTLSDLVKLRQEAQTANPDLLQARAELRRAEHQVAYEKAQRWPTVALKATQDEDPELRSSRAGVVISIPLWDRRSGPVGEAVAQLSRSRNDLEHREFTLGQELEAAYEQYQIAQTQVTALESGIVRQAENALNIAQAAYRFGERGILEVLDAQRVYRAARNELITARYELAAAWAEIERLRAPR